LDKEKVIAHRLFRESCTFFYGAYLKDLSKLNRDMKNIVMIDVIWLSTKFDFTKNSEIIVKAFPDNSILIPNYYADKSDREFETLIPFLRFLSYV